MSKPSKTSSNSAPKLSPKTIKLEWDLKNHYYKSESDPQIEKDAATAERLVRAFVRTYKNKDFTATNKTLLKTLTDYEKLSEHPHASRVMRYYSFRSTLNVNDETANKKLNLYSQRFKKLSNEMLFFRIRFGKLAKVRQREALKDPKLAHFKYFLKSIFEEAKHQLSEPEERILTLRSSTSSGMWADAVEKVLSNRTVTFGGKKLAVPEALEVVDVVTPAQKPKLWKQITAECRSVAEFSEHELTAIVTHEKVSDELRGFEKPYSGTVLAYENNEKAVETLIEAISTTGFKLSQKFYKQKAKLAGTKTIPYVNKYDPIGSLPKPTFEESVEICREAFYDTDSRYGEIFDTMLTSGQIDVYPKAGKRGGAFCASDTNVPTYVMLNHTKTFKALETLAHEMGHAIHGERSKTQSPLYEDYSTVTAETASTFFEQLVGDRVMDTLTHDQKVIFLHDKIARDIATVQRQIAFFNFELQMHEHIRETGAATHKELAQLMQKHLAAYLGPAVDVTEDDGYSFVYIPHIRYGFYVYSYSYGHLVSNLMLKRYKEDASYLEKIDGFLTSGGNDTVENIFKHAGINTMKLDTFKESLSRHEDEIKLFTKLTS